MAKGGTQIGYENCNGCGAKVILKENANGNVYYYCDGQAADTMCGHHEKYGPAKSRKVKAEIEGKKGKSNGGTTEQRDGGNGTGNGAAEPGKPAERKRTGPFGIAS